MIDTIEGSFAIGGLDPHALVERFGTPLFVYDTATVRESYARIARCFSYAPTHLHFAAVCNPNLHLLRVLRAAGAGLHANSPGDVYCGLRAGYAPDQIVFSGSNLGEDDLSYLLASGVHVNVDSLDDLAAACAIAPDGSFGVRIHLEDVLPESRIGLREHELDTALALARASGAKLTALHVYCGTHGQRLDRYEATLHRLVELAARLPDLAAINLGGGFGYDYHDPEGRSFPFEALGRAADAALVACSQRAGRPIVLRAEPGRALVAAAGVLLTRVRSVKTGRDQRYVGVDTTVGNLPSHAVHGAHRRVVSVSARRASALPADICGSTTYSRDVIAHRTELPEVARGDLLAVLDCGAYGYCMSSHFLNRPRPAEVFVDAGCAVLATRRETFEDLVDKQPEPTRPELARRAPDEAAE